LLVTAAIDDGAGGSRRLTDGLCFLIIGYVASPEFVNKLKGFFAMRSWIRFVVCVIVLGFFFGSAVTRAQQKALTADQMQVVSAVTAIFDAATHDDLGKFHSVVEPGFISTMRGRDLMGTRL
jgi:hypothetical protein